MDGCNAKFHAGIEKKDLEDFVLENTNCVRVKINKISEIVSGSELQPPIERSTAAHWPVAMRLSFLVA